jgi:hypothetical protein
MTEDDRRPDESAAQPPATSNAPSHSDLERWSTQRGMVLLPTAEFENLCAAAASAYAAEVDLNEEFDTLFRTGH